MANLSDTRVIETFSNSLLLVLPEAVLAGWACLLAVHGMLLKARGLNWTLAFLGLATAAGLAAAAPWLEPAVATDLTHIAPLLPGPLAAFIRWLVLGCGLILLMLSTREAVRGIAGEYYACLFVALAGCSLTARANDLVLLFIALEMISIPTYILLYLPNRDVAAQEAAQKYFLLSIIASALFLFGLSHLYGMTGASNITALVGTLTNAHQAAAAPLAVLAMVMVLAGLSFRIAAVPFHFYAPDVYQGGPTAAVAMLAVLPKIAGFVAMARLLGIDQALDNLPFADATRVPLMIWVMAAITMTLGNIMALIQDNLQRLMAYSGIAHTGYMLLGVLAALAHEPTHSARLAGLESVLVYLTAYALMTLGVFAVLARLDRSETVDDLAGLGRTNPLAAFALAVALLSLIGLPLTAGFIGKLMLLFGLIDTPSDAGLGHLYLVLVAIAAVNAAIGAVYYIRLLSVIYFRSPLDPEAGARGVGPLLAALVCALGTLLLGVVPGLITKPAANAAPAIMLK